MATRTLVRTSGNFYVLMTTTPGPFWGSKLSKCKISCFWATLLAVFSSWVVWYGLKQYCSCRAFHCNSLDTPHGYICNENFLAQNRAPQNWWPYFGPKFIHCKYSRVGCLESRNKMPCNNNTVLDHVKWPSWRKRPKKGPKKQLISHFGCFDPPNCPGSGLIKT